jgi:virginiamycin B lyase
LLLSIHGFLAIILIVGLSYTFLISSIHVISGQLPITEDIIQYEKNSNFIKEFKIPINERGLKGITTDSGDNVWFYHATANASMIMKMSKEGTNIAKYPIVGNTITDTAVINLAGGQLIFDNTSDLIWFTDARTNSMGKLDIKSSKIQLFSIPTNNSGIMGLALSPDKKVVWFTEIIGNKIGTLDVASNKITEYPTGDNSGPTLLTFDRKGILWVTLSYANSILRVEPWLLIPGTKSSAGMYALSLEKPDFFSPFGIAIGKINGIEKLVVSDHGSSRVIVANIDSDLKNYTSYWTSPSKALPMSLPTQVVSDKLGNIFFLEHGGNKIVKIFADNGVMTEFDIPTGPLSDSLFLSVSDDAMRIWFTESKSNKIAYLDNTIGTPLALSINGEKQSSQESNQSVILKEGDSYSINVTLTLDKNVSSLVSANDTTLSIVGMTDSGLQGIKYTSIPSTLNLTEFPEKKAKTELDLKVERDKAIAGIYTVMIRVSLLERGNLILSTLYPQMVKLDVPKLPSAINKSENFEPYFTTSPKSPESTTLLSRDNIKIGAAIVAVALAGYLIYHNIVRRRNKSKETKK